MFERCLILFVLYSRIHVMFFLILQGRSALWSSAPFFNLRRKQLIYEQIFFVLTSLCTRVKNQLQDISWVLLMSVIFFTYFSEYLWQFNNVVCFIPLFLAFYHLSCCGTYCSKMATLMLVISYIYHRTSCRLVVLFKLLFYLHIAKS